MKKLKNILFGSGVAVLIAVVCFGAPTSRAQSPQPPSAGSATSQEDSVMLVDMEADRIEKRGAQDSTIYLIDNVKFHHNGAIIECDSASRYDDYRMEFFGKVIINQDSAYVYGDRVLYDGRTSIAEVFAPLVKMMRGDVTLYSYNLTFDTKTNTGSYVGGGVLTNPDNFMESERGEFNANTNIVKFKDSVLMRSESYTIRTDSMDYNLDREIATFLARTTVWDKDSNILIADRGYYFNAKALYDFVGNAYVLTPDQEMWGDTLSYYQPLRQATMKSNVQLLDTIQKTIALSDWAFYDDSLSKAVLTRKPAVIMYDSLESDKIYLRADSIVMSSYDYGTAPRPYPVEKKINSDSVLRESELEMKEHDHDHEHDHEHDSDQMQGERSDRQGDGQQGGGQQGGGNRGGGRGGNRGGDNGGERGGERGADRNSDHSSSNQNNERASRREEREEDKVKIETPIVDTTAVALDSLAIDQGESMSSFMDSLSQANQKPIDSTAQQRVIDAFHNVKQWAKGYQMVSDSMVAYLSDSITSLFGRPILWSDGSQIAADRIDAYIANELLDWVDFIGSPFMTQSLQPKWREPQDSSRFNQVSSRQMQAFFTKGEIDSTVVIGNVQNYYYYTDDVGYTSAFATVECPLLVVFFEDREPSKMSWRGSTKFDIYPLEMIPEKVSERMENFQWDPDLKPKGAWEITTRKVRKTNRESIESMEQPLFPIENRIDLFKTTLLERGTWQDRTDEVTVTPEYFMQNNRYEL